jgi:hypothetical protein
MALQGNLATFELTSILQLLFTERKTGILTLSRDQEQVRIYFQAGAVIYATGNQPGCRLGQFLRRQGAISADQLRKCLETAQRKKLSIGRILVAKGYVSIEKLKQFIHAQTEEIILNLFLWGNAEFSYRDKRINTDRIVITRLNVMKLILDASRRIDEMSVLTQQISSETLVFRISDDMREQEQVKLDANEWRILTLIDGRRCVRQIIEKSGYDRYAVYKVLYALLSSGLVVRAEVAFEEPAGLEPYAGMFITYNDIMSELYHRLKDELGRGAEALLDRCLRQIDPALGAPFEAYHPRRPSPQNLQAIHAALRTFRRRDEGYARLITFAGELLSSVLEQSASVLGRRWTQSVAARIRRIAASGRRQAPILLEQKRLLDKIAAVIDHAEKGFNDEAASTGEKPPASRRWFGLLKG